MFCDGSVVLRTGDWGLGWGVAGREVAEEENESGLQGAERQGSGEGTGRGRGMKEGRWGGRAKVSAEQVLWRNLECGLLLYVSGGYERLESGKESTVTCIIL